MAKKSGPTAAAGPDAKAASAASRRMTSKKRGRPYAYAALAFVAVAVAAFFTLRGGHLAQEDLGTDYDHLLPEDYEDRPQVRLS